MSLQLSGEAIVLRRVDFKEHDLLVYLYTQESGLIKVLATGAKKFNSKLAAHLEPISLVNYLCIINHFSYKLVSVNNLNYFQDIRDNLIKQNTVGLIFNYFNKIVKENEADYSLFNHLKTWLEYFNKQKIENSNQADAYLLIFLIKFLEILGFAIDIKECCLKSESKTFDFKAGSFICQECQSEDDKNRLIINQEAFELLRQLINKEKNISFSEKGISETKQLLLKFLDYNHSLDKFKIYG